jgi:hypothetical protein
MSMWSIMLSGIEFTSKNVSVKFTALP